MLCFMSFALQKVPVCRSCSCQIFDINQTGISTNTRNKIALDDNIEKGKFFSCNGCHRKLQANVMPSICFLNDLHVTEIILVL